MPALCWPIDEGGVGFGARLSMAIPDVWIKTLKHKSDEQWDFHELCHTMENRCGCFTLPDSRDLESTKVKDYQCMKIGYD